MADNYTNDEAAFSGSNVNSKLDFNGNIKIADDVISSIAALAATDVEGVHGMAGYTTNELVARLGGKPVAKGVKAIVDGDDVRFSLAIIAEYGYSIPDVCRKVQDKVRTTVDNMTGLSTSEVNVTIAGINVPGNA